MISEKKIYVPVKLNWHQVAVTMLCIWDFSEKESAEIISRDESFVKETRRELRKKFNETDTSVMALHALTFGFKADGTLHDEDIFNDEQKHRILLVNDDIAFRYPPKKGK